MNPRATLCFWLIVFYASSACASKWDAAAARVKMLHPEEVVGLPEDAKEKFESVGCSVPQPTFYAKAPENVAPGDFDGSGSMDYAAVCRVKSSEFLYVVWGGASSCPSIIVTEESITGFLQEVGGGKIEYSRMIGVVHAGSVREYENESGQMQEIRMSHQGIEDFFLEKGSSIHYCKDGRWLVLIGAD